MSKKRMASVWLDGCSGCHMSFLDLDERLITLAESADLVYSPLVDAKIFPEDVDVTLVEGAVSSEEDLHKIRMVRERTKDSGVSGRLRGDRECSWDEKLIRDESGVRTRIYRKCDAQSQYPEPDRSGSVAPLAAHP